MGPRVRISLDLIQRRITEKITPSEEIIFQLWITQSDAHSQFHKRAEKYFLNGSNYNSTPDRTKQAWIQLERSLDRLNKRRTLIITYGTVASIAASVIIILLFNIFQNNTTEIVADTALTPGREKATLILDNGKEVELDKNKEIKISKKQSISVDNNTLKYEEIKVKKLTFNTLKVSRGETFSLNLSDGTKVYLNSQTVLRYPVQFADDLRTVELLEGEAFFEVAKNKSIPFQIISNNQTIEVLGTSFNVSAYSDENFIQTTLVEGKVQVFETLNPDTPQILQPNEQLTFDKQIGSYVKRTVNPSLYTSWKDGIYYFEDVELQEIMKILSRWYNYDVVFIDSSLANTRFGGKLKRMDSLNNLLSLIGATSDIQFEIENDTIYIQ